MVVSLGGGAIAGWVVGSGNTTSKALSGCGRGTRCAPRSRCSLRCLLTAAPFVRVEARCASRLASSGFPQPVAPFIPTRVGW